MSKRFTTRILAGTAAAVLVSLAALTAPAQAADSAWGRSAKTDSHPTRIIGAPAPTRIIGVHAQRIIG